MRSIAMLDGVPQADGQEFRGTEGGILPFRHVAGTPVA